MVSRKTNCTRCLSSDDDYEARSAARVALSSTRSAFLAASLSEAPGLMSRLALQLRAASLGVAPGVYACFKGRTATGARGIGWSHRRTSSAWGFFGQPCGVCSATRCAAPRTATKLRRRFYNATGAVARKLRALAEDGYWKLNQTPDGIVFLPKLVETPEGSLVSTGFTLQTRDVELKGQPAVVDFDA